MPPEALANDVDAERVAYLGRHPGLVHCVRRWERVLLIVDVGREADRERVLVVECRALVVGRSVHDLLLIEDEDLAEARHNDGGILDRGRVYSPLEL